MIKGLINKDTPKAKLEEIAIFPKMPKAVLSSAIYESGSSPVLDQGKSFIAGYSDSSSIFNASKEDPVILFGDHTCKFEYVDFDFVIGGPGVKLVKSPNCNLRYLYHALVFNGPKPGNYGRHFKYLTKSWIPLPPLQDQIRIANFLDQFSEAIKLQEESLDLLKLEKQILLEKIFDDRNFRFYLGGKLFASRMWITEPLIALGVWVRSYGVSRANTDETSELRSLHYGEIHKGGDLSYMGIPYSGVSFKNPEYLKKFDVVFADTAEDYTEVGKSLFIPNDVPNLTAGMHTHAFRPDLSKVIPAWITQYTKSSSFKRQMKKLSTGLVVAGVGKPALGKTSIRLPSLQEQQLIAGYFSQLDERISLETERLELLKLEQKVVLSKIFAT